MRNWNWKAVATDLAADILASVMISLGVYNFALHSDFPVAGFSGIALILYHLWGLPVGAGIVLLNIPVAVLCYKFLGRGFFFRSVKTTVISSFFIDYVAPCFPTYSGGNIVLAAVCTGALCGAGYALIFMRGSSTGGQDFITMSIKKIRPHMTLGIINFVLDMLTITVGSLVIYRNMDGFICGIIITYIMSSVIDKVLYGVDQGKFSIIVTERGQEMARQIDEFSGRGSTIVKGTGSYTGREKAVVLCACNNKQMYAIKKLARQVDPKAFTIIMESNEVLGEGFKGE